MADSVIILRRLLAIAILLAIPIGGWMSVVRPVAESVSERQAHLDRSLNLLAGYRRIAAVGLDQKKQLTSARAHNTKPIGFVGGASTEIAAANFQGSINKIIRANQGIVRTEQNLPVGKVGEFIKLAFRYEILIPMSALPQLIYEIESFVPYLIFDAIEIRAAENQGQRGRNGREPRLTVRWTVSGYRQLGNGI